MLGADLSKIFCNAYMTYVGSVGIRVWVDDANGQRLLDKVYEDGDSLGTNWAATEAAYGQCVSHILQAVLRKVANDVNSAVQGAAPSSAARVPNA